MNTFTIPRARSGAAAFVDVPGVDDTTKWPVKVVIVYDAPGAAVHAMRALAPLTNKLNHDVESRRPIFWRFDLLRDPDFREIATTEAVDADIVIVASRDTAALPQTITDWADALLGRSGDTDPLIITLTATGDESLSSAAKG